MRAPSEGSFFPAVVYPYLHLTRARLPLRQRLRDALDFGQRVPPSVDSRMDQGEGQNKQWELTLAELAG